MLRLKSYILPIMIGIILGFATCTLEEDDDPTQPDARDKFLGTWKVNESCQRGNYTVTVKLDPSHASQVLIEGFGNPGPGYDPAVGSVVLNNIYISPQVIGEGWSVSGQGSYQKDGTISWEYFLVISGSDINCTAIYWQ